MTPSHREPNDITCHSIGAAMLVHNELGMGFHEKPYENALAIELRIRGFRVEQQHDFPILYRDHKVGFFIPDLLVNDSVIIDAKVIDAIGAAEIGQMINYLRVAKKELRLIINFKHARLEWKRVMRSGVLEEGNDADGHR